MIKDIKALKASYFLSLDQKRWADFARLFTPDCEFITYADLEGAKPKKRLGPDAIVASVSRKVGDALTVHQGKLVHFDVESAESVTAVWAMTDHTETTDGASRRIYRGSGTYHERYRRLNGMWLIARLELKRTSFVVE